MIRFVVKPADNRNSVLDIVTKTADAIVYNDRFRLGITRHSKADKIAIQHIQVLNVVAVDEQAVIAIQAVTTHYMPERTRPDKMLVCIENIEDAVSIASHHTAAERKPLLRRCKNDNLVVRRNSFQEVEEEGADIGEYVKPVVLVKDLR